MTQNNPYLVAITGGIATGKSTAVNYINMRGYRVIDFDKISHEILNTEIVKTELVNSFGSSILSSGSIDRKKLGKLVFNNIDDLKKLNNITHSRIYRAAKKSIDKIRDERIVFLDIPLLFETKNQFSDFYSKIDEIWVITSNIRVQITRLMIRDKLSSEEAERKINIQMNLRLKERLGDVVIYNNSDFYNLYDDIRLELNNLEKRVKFQDEKIK